MTKTSPADGKKPQATIGNSGQSERHGGRAISVRHLPTPGSRTRCGGPGDQEFAELSVAFVEAPTSPASLQMLSWISMNCLASAWHWAQMNRSPD
jgi:hypothetical protein